MSCSYLILSSLNVKPISTDENFQPYDKLPSHLVPTSKNVLKFAGHYLDVGTKKFDWIGFKKAIDDYRGTDLTFDMYKHNPFSFGTVTVQSVASQISDFLLKSFKMPVDLVELTADIESAFTNLKERKENGWADFSRSSDSSNSSYTYRVLFALPSATIEQDFFSLVTTIKFTADIHEESSWWGLVSSSRHDFSAEVDGLQLVVTEGFVDPSEFVLFSPQRFLLTVI